MKNIIFVLVLLLWSLFCFSTAIDVTANTNYTTDNEFESLDAEENALNTDEPAFEKEPEDITIFKANSKFDCVVNVGFSKCYWFKNGKNLIVNIDSDDSNFVIEKNETTGECYLVIKFVQVEFIGTTWSCQVEFNTGVKLNSRNATINFIEKFNNKPTVTIRGASTAAATEALSFVAPNEMIVLDFALVGNYPFANKDSIAITVDGETKNIDGDISFDEYGRNNVKTELSLNINKDLIVIKYRNKEDPSPTIQDQSLDLMANINTIPLPSYNRIVAMGEKIKLEPFLNVGKGYNIESKWNKYDIKTGHWDTITTSSYQTDFNFVGKTVGTETMQYTGKCKFTQVTMHSEKVKITTYEPVELNITSNHAVSLNGNTVTLVCEAIKGNPKPEFLWVKETNYQFLIVGRNSNLTIGPSSDDVGKYKCEAVQHVSGRRLITIARQYVHVTD